MAKYRLTSDSRRSVECDVLNESAGKYVVRFKNGVVRCVNKGNVSDFNRIDEAVLDSIRDFGRAAADKAKAGFEKVKLFLSGIFKFVTSDDCIGIMLDGNVISARHPATMLTSRAALNAPISVIEIPEETANFIESCGLRVKRPMNCDLHDDETYKEFMNSFPEVGDIDVNESLKINGKSALFERKYAPAVTYQDALNSEYHNDIPFPGTPERVRLSSQEGYADVCASEIVDMIRSEYLDRYDARYDENFDFGPLRIWGAPGTGKSAIVKSLKDKFKTEGKKIQVITINGNALGAHDLAQSGHIDVSANIPVRNEGVDKDVTDFVIKEIRRQAIKSLPQTWLPVFDLDPNLSEDELIAANMVANGGHEVKKNGKSYWQEGDGGIIFIDEYSRLSESAKNALMTLPTSRSISNSDAMHLGSRWVVVVAANRMEDMSNYNQRIYTTTVEPADRSRFDEITYVPAPSEWVEWAISPRKDGRGPQIFPEIVEYVKYSICTGGPFKAERVNSVNDDAIDDYANFARSDYYNVYRVSSAGGKLDQFKPNACPRTWTHFSNRLSSLFRHSQLGFGGRNLADLSPVDIYNLGVMTLGAGPSCRFAEFVSNVYGGFTMEDAKQIWTKGANGDYEFMKNGAGWINCTNFMDRVQSAMFPLMNIAKNEVCDAGGNISPDAVENAVKFFVKLYLTCGLNGGGENSELFNGTMYYFKKEFKLNGKPEYTDQIKLINDIYNSFRNGKHQDILNNL